MYLDIICDLPGSAWAVCIYISAIPLVKFLTHDLHNLVTERKPRSVCQTCKWVASEDKEDPIDHTNV